MKILFYRYGSICEPDILSTLHAFGITVAEETEEITNKAFTPAQCAERVAAHLMRDRYAFVFSVNFYPAISDICNKLQIPYVCWSVDCPVLELFSNSIRNPYNRIFLFDFAQYERFSPYNPDCIWYLPLATNTARWDQVLSGLTAADIAAYSADISLVGSLYSEKSPLAQLPALSAYAQGYIDALCEAQSQLYGCCFLEEALTPQIIDAVKAADPDFYAPQNTVCNTDAYVAAHQYIGMQLAFLERIRALELLSARHSVSLYTRSDSSMLPCVKNCGQAKTLTEMPKIFHLSKINLNITIRPIQTGLSLRIWDVLGCGGFLLTNYQAELPEYFEIGTDLETYSDLKELCDKAEYYLHHEEERKAIAQNGYNKVKNLHTYEARLTSMLRILTETFKRQV